MTRHQGGPGQVVHHRTLRAPGPAQVDPGRGRAPDPGARAVGQQQTIHRSLVPSTMAGRLGPMVGRWPR